MTDRCADPKCIPCQIGMGLACSVTEQRIYDAHASRLRAALRAEFADGRAALLRARASMPKGSARTDLDRCINRLRTLLDGEDVEEQAA